MVVKGREWRKKEIRVVQSLGVRREWMRRIWEEGRGVRVREVEGVRGVNGGQFGG